MSATNSHSANKYAQEGSCYDPDEYRGADYYDHLENPMTSRSDAPLDQLKTLLEEINRDAWQDDRTRLRTIARTSDRALQILASLPSERGEKDEAYRQRNVLVAAFARMYPSGIRRTNIEGWSEDWHGCVYIDLPSGQISYHYHDSQAHLFAGLPPYTKEWDGSDKKTVEDRLLTITAVAATPNTTNVKESK